MVDLPKVTRRLVTTEAPQSGLSARDIAAPYAFAAEAAREISGAVESVAEANVEDAAARAVTVGADGEIQVERTAIPMVGKVGRHYDRLVRTGAVVQADAIADRDLLDLRQESRGDPAAFMAAAEAYRDQRVGQLSETVGEAGGAALRRQIDNRITASYGSLLAEHQNIAIKRNNEAIDARITTLSDEMETLARRNGIGPEYDERLANVRALLAEKVNNPLLAFPQEKADAFLDTLNTRVQGAAIHESTERVYRERGYDAARTYLRESVRSLDGKVKQLDKIEMEGLKLLRAEEARLKGDRDGISREWAAARGQAADLDPAVLEDIQARAAAVGNTRVATDVAVTRRAIETRAAVRSLPVDEQARLVGGGTSGAPSSLVNRIVGAESGGDPNARATTSSATGAGQFIKSTWIDLVKRTRPDLAEGKSDEQILALRTDPALSREMVGRYAEQNRQQLAAAGVPVNDGALYLAHFLGPGDAIKVLSAPPGTPLAGLVAPASIAANQGIFGRNPTTDALAGWASGKVGGASPENRADLLARQMLKKDLAGDLTTTLAGVTARVARGEFPDAGEMTRLGSLISVVGTPEQRRKAATLMAISQVGAEFQNMPAPQRDALVSQIENQIKESGGQAESDLTQALRTADGAISKAYKEDAYGAYYRYGRGEMAEPTPAIDFGNPIETAAIVQGRLAQQHVIREEQGIGPFSVLRPTEAEAFRGAMAQGSAQQVATMMTGLSALPEDVLAATVAQPAVKAGITGALHTTDPQKMAAVMSTLDTWYRRDPQAFNTRFGPEAWNALKTWQSNLRYMTPEQFTEHQTKAQDPNVAELRAKNISKAEEEARKRAPADVVAAMNPSFFSSLTGTTPVVPTDPQVRDLLMADYVNLYGRRFAETLDKDVAHQQAAEALGQKWARSTLNSNEMMLRAPETVYPAVNGDHGWMTPQIEAAVAERIGVPVRRDIPIRMGPAAQGTPLVGQGDRNWDYRIVADSTTEQQAQRYDRRLPVSETNPAPSYRVIWRDNRRTNPRWEPVAGRFAFDPNVPQETSRARFLPTPDADGGGGGF
jgi:hypothetical protein